MPKASFRVSVLICTWNRGELINATLESLIEGSRVKADEIVVVNGGGDKDCSPTLAYWKERCPYLREVKTQNINLANSRNVGFKAVTGDVVLLTDDDARVFTNWIETMISAHEKYPDAGVVGGEVVDASGDSLVSRIADISTFPRYSKVQEVRHVPGVNCSYKREVIEQVGEQDLSLFRGEDVDYNWRAIKAGWKIIYHPAIKVYHAHRPSWSGLYNQHHMYGRAYVRVRRKWPEMYCAYPRHYKTPKMWAKAVYYLITPWLYAFKKTNELTKIGDKFLGFFIILSISYYTMYGSFLQWKFDRS